MGVAGFIPSTVVVGLRVGLGLRGWQHGHDTQDGTVVFFINLKPRSKA